MESSNHRSPNRAGAIKLDLDDHAENQGHLSGCLEQSRLVPLVKIEAETTTVSSVAGDAPSQGSLETHAYKPTAVNDETAVAQQRLVASSSGTSTARRLPRG